MENNSVELQHHGILGMRWGVRRYQNKDGSLTKAGKKRYGDDDDKNSKDVKESRKVRKARKAEEAKKAKEAEEAKKAEEDKKTYEEGKQHALKSGSAADVLKYKGDLTKQEMDAAIARIRWERDMKDISDKELAESKQNAKKFFGKVENATNYAITGAKAYNMVANVANAFRSPDSVSLPKIDTNVLTGNKTIRANEKKKKREAEKAAKEEAKMAKEAAKKKTETETATGEVFGEGTSKRSDRSSGKKYSDTVFEAEWRDVTPSDLPVEYKSRGQSFVSGLLEEPKK